MGQLVPDAPNFSECQRVKIGAKMVSGYGTQPLATGYPDYRDYCGYCGGWGV
jgi:hypothetical protein